jgi:hypothetical protein
VTRAEAISKILLLCDDNAFEYGGSRAEEQEMRDSWRDALRALGVTDAEIVRS